VTQRSEASPSVVKRAVVALHVSRDACSLLVLGPVSPDDANLNINMGMI
jgi:hypothetical protein